MTWLRLDDGFAANKKVVQLSDKEFRVWVRTLCYCSEQDDPTIDRFTMGEVRGLTRAVVTRLEKLGLVDRAGTRTWEVHDWVHYRPKDSTAAERQARWRARQTVTPTVTEGVTETVTSTVTKASLAHADPSRPDLKDLQVLRDMDAA